MFSAEQSIQLVYRQRRHFWGAAVAWFAEATPKILRPLWGAAVMQIPPAVLMTCIVFSRYQGAVVYLHVVALERSQCM